MRNVCLAGKENEDHVYALFEEIEDTPVTPNKFHNASMISHLPYLEATIERANHSVKQA